MALTNSRRIRNSDTSLSIEDLYLEGVKVSLDDWKETLLLDDNPILIPGNNQFVLLPSEIGLQPPNYFCSSPYTGLSIYEEYLGSSYYASGVAVFAGISGSGPAHTGTYLTGYALDLSPLYGTGLLMNPLSGSFYLKNPANPLDKSYLFNFSINSGQNANYIQFPSEIKASGGYLLGVDLYYSLSGLEDLSIVMMGKYNDLSEDLTSQGVVMSSGDNAFSFYMQYVPTGTDILEFYSANEFVATRWGVYCSESGTGPADIGVTGPLSGKFYHRNPQNKTKNYFADFSLNSGDYANWDSLPSEYSIPFRNMVGIDVYSSLEDVRNVNVVLGGKSITSANYYKNLITKTQFDIFSGAITGLITESIVGVASLNGLYGEVSVLPSGNLISQISGSNIYLDVDNDAFVRHDQTGDFVTNSDTGVFVDKSETGIFATYTNLTDASGYLESLIAAGGTNVGVTGGPNMAAANFIGGGNVSVTSNGSDILVSGIEKVTFSSATNGGYYFFETSQASTLVSFTGNNRTTGIIGPNASYAFNVGDYISIAQEGTGIFLISGSGCSVNSRGGLKNIAGQYGVAELVYKGSDTWLLYGDLS
jgi:hypothetical protein